MRAWQKLSATQGGFTGGLAAGDAFGSAVAALGDLDGDGLSELAIGAPFEEVTIPDRGSVFVCFLRPDGTVRAHAAHAGQQRDVLFGSALAAPGDLDGDGIPDLAVGAPGRPQLDGRLSLILLDATGDRLLRREFEREDFQPTLPHGATFAAGLAAVRAAQHDGVVDLLVGVPGTRSAGEIDLLLLNGAR